MASTGAPPPGADASASASGSRREFESEANNVHLAMAPRIAVFESADVGECLRGPNGLDDDGGGLGSGFSALLRPFEASVRGVGVTTSLLEKRTCDVFPLRFDAAEHFAPARPGGGGGGASQQQQQHGFNRLRTRPEEMLDSMSAYITGKFRTTQGAEDAWGSKCRPIRLTGREEIEAEVLQRE